MQDKFICIHSVKLAISGRQANRKGDYLAKLFGRKNNVKKKSTIAVSDDYLGESELIISSFSLCSNSSSSSNFEDKVKQVREMIRISQPISSSVRLYVDDSLQTFPNGRLTQVNSDSSEIKDCVQFIIDSLEIEDYYGTIASQLVLFGNSYACHPDIDLSKKKKLNESVKIDKTFYQKTQKDLEAFYITEVTDVQDIRVKGKQIGFLVVDELESTSQGVIGFFTKMVISEEKYTLFPSSQYTHFYLDNYLSFDKDTRQADINGKTETIEVFSGSGLFDGLYNTAVELKLMKDAILLQRVTRQASSLFIGVEVGDLPKEEVKKVVNKYKQMIGQKNLMTSESFSSTSAPSGTDTIIISPIRNGKGDLSTQRIGGDVDIKTLIDLEYFEDELFSGLPPRQFLGKHDEGGGLNSGQSLAVQDIRHARTVSRIQNAIERGVREIIDKVLTSFGKSDYINKYTISLSKVNSAEDNEKLDLQDRKIEVADSLINMYEKLGYDIQSDEVKQQVSDITGFSKIEDTVEEASKEENQMKLKTDREFEDFDDNEDFNIGDEDEKEI